MLREPRLAVFYSPPKHDLRLHYDEEEEEERRGQQKPWPDLGLVLHDDPEYQRLLAGIQSYVDMEMELLKQYATVSWKSGVIWYCIAVSWILQQTDSLESENIEFYKKWHDGGYFRARVLLSWWIMSEKMRSAISLPYLI